MKFKVSAKTIIQFLIIFLFFPPPFLDQIISFDWFNRFLALGRYGVMICVMINCILKHSWRTCINEAFLATAFICVILRLLSSWMNHTIAITNSLFQCAIVGFLIWNVYTWKDDKYKLIKLYLKIFGTYLWLNFISQMMKLGGISTLLFRENFTYFLGNKNNISTYIVLYILLNMYLHIGDTESHYNYTYRWLLIKCMLWSLVSRCSTALLLCLLFIIYYIVDAALHAISRKLEHMLSRSSLLIGLLIIILFFFVVVAQGNNSIGILGFLTHIVGRDLTFNGRLAIWNYAIEIFSQNPLWGIGEAIGYNVWGNNIIVHSAHNTVLNSLVVYGLPATVSFFAVFAVVIQHIMKLKSDNRLWKMLILASISWAIVMIFEATENYMTTWLIFLMIYLISDSRERR